MKIIEAYYKDIRYDVLVDDEDYEFLSKHRWYVRGNHKYKYVVCALDYKKIPIHRMIMEKHDFDIKNKVIDHIDGNTHDNRKCNLRVATNQENIWNSKIGTCNKTGYKGVHFRKDGSRFVASIKENGNGYEIASFTNKYDAAIAYDIYAKKYFGEFAKTNFKQIPQEDIDRVLLEINKQKNRTYGSEYRGVIKHKNNQFSYQIRRGERYIQSKRYDIERLAAIGYDLKIKELYGEDKNLNCPDATNEEIEFVKNFDNSIKRGKNSSSIFRGVIKTKHGSFHAGIQYKNKQIYLGSFEKETDAAIAYNEKAKEFFGKRAKLNIIT